MNDQYTQNRKLLSILIILALIAAVVSTVWWFMGSGAQNGKVPKAVQVMYTPNGFEPAQVTIKQGTTVTFLDRDGGGMLVASLPDPTHSGYAGTPSEKHCPDASGLSFDQCTKGVMYSFTFQKTGTWEYHNHEHPEMKGAITVTQ